MIKALLLIFEPARTWDNIDRAKRSLWAILTLYLTPLIALSVGGEMLGIIYLGRPTDLGEGMRLSRNQLIAYAAAQALFSFGIVFIGAKLVKSVAETFHTRHTYTQSFTLVAYALGPLFLMKLCDAFPAMNPWVSFGIGMVLSLAILYHGVPRVLQPDPPQAFGLFLISGFLLALVSGLARLVTFLLITGKVKMFLKI